MRQRQPLLPRFVARLRRLRHELFAREPSASEWEERLERIVSETVAESLRWIPEQGSFLDVGANVGVYAEGVLRARPQARAWLFEPVRTHYERCRQRFEGRSGVVVENLALGDEGGEATIWKLKHNPGGNTLVHELAERWRLANAGGEKESAMHFRPETVRCRVFDEYAREHGIERVDFIKSDTEGFDYRVLRGMLGFLGRCDPKPVILAELWRSDVFPDYAGQMSVLDSLYALGYARVDLSGMKLAQDFLFVPKGREPLR